MSYMPDTRSHRGPHPGDAQLFTTQTLPVLRRAVSEMSWLLSRGYGDKSSQKLVGDRYTLTQRQRLAVMRACCSDSQLENRTQKQMPPDEIESEQLLIDGYNLLITVEAALAGAPLFIGRDGCIRDLASVHGTYRKVQETLPAIEVIAHILNDLKMSEVFWFPTLADSSRSSCHLLKETDSIGMLNSSQTPIRYSSHPAVLSSPATAIYWTTVKHG
jgi:hypothetical protein